MVGPVTEFKINTFKSELPFFLLLCIKSFVITNYFYAPTINLALNVTPPANVSVTVAESPTAKLDNVAPVKPLLVTAGSEATTTVLSLMPVIVTRGLAEAAISTPY